MARQTFAASGSAVVRENDAPDLGKGRRIARVIAWVSVALACAGGLAELLGGVGHRLQWWSAGAGIAVLGAGAVAAAVAVLVALAALFIAWVAGVRGPMLTAGAGLALGLLLAAPPLALWRQAATLPAIHDISTDTENPPRFAAVLPLRAGAPNGVEYSADVAAQQKAAYPEVAPAMLPHTPRRTFELAEQAARRMGWEVVAVSAPELRIEATATTLLFGFTDDVVVRVTPAPMGSRVDVRSVSRVGRSDVGTNARRIRTYLRTLGKLSRDEA